MKERTIKITTYYDLIAMKQIFLIGDSAHASVSKGSNVHRLYLLINDYEII